WQREHAAVSMSGWDVEDPEQARSGRRLERATLAEEEGLLVRLPFVLLHPAREKTLWSSNWQPSKVFPLVPYAVPSRGGAEQIRTSQATYRGGTPHVAHQGR